MTKPKRKSKVKRTTKETSIAVDLVLDGTGKSDIKTGIGFLDHMLALFAKHGLFNLKVRAKGDLVVDSHHTNEDVGITLGEVFKKALGKKAGIRRYGYSFVPMDEALASARVVLDISGRPSLFFSAFGGSASSRNTRLRQLSPASYTVQDAKEFLRAFASSSGINMHADLVRGEDTHHVIEALFKAVARALREAVSIDKRVKGIPSTKGRL